MKTWAGVFAQDLRFIVRATLAVMRHHLIVRPRYGSTEWHAFRDNLLQDYDYRHGHSAIRPVPHAPPWSLGYPTIRDEKPPISLASLPVAAGPWPRGTVLH
jgi:hypothetical protein